MLLMKRCIAFTLRSGNTAATSLWRHVGWRTQERFEENRRGILCRVIEGGRISRGDAIEIINTLLMPRMEECVEQ